MTSRSEPIRASKEGDVYDRSSLKGDFMVVIEGQTEEEWWRRRPEDRFCEYWDGVIYFHPPNDRSHEELETERGTYDRSSLVGDFMVILEDQTSEDFERYAPEEQFCDYLEGRVYMPSPVSARHQEQVGFLHTMFDGFRQQFAGWTLLLGPAVLRLDTAHKPEPDLFLIPEVGHGAGAPASLVIEVLSESTRSHDLGRKLQAYKGAGIPEIWFLDERERQLIAVRWTEGSYQSEHYSTGIVTSSAVEGFWIDLAWLWANPLPGAFACASRIVAGPPI